MTMATTGMVTSADGTSIAFTKAGSGPALVLVDGALCFRDNGPSADLMRELGARFTVFAYDRRGRGESEAASGWSADREIEDLHAIIGETGETAFVFGASSGGALALHAVGAGLPIAKVAVYEPPIGVTRPGGPSLDDARRSVDALISARDDAGAARYFLTTMLGVPRLMVAAMPMFMRSTWRRLESVAATLPSDLGLLDGPRFVQRATDVRVPALVIGGAKSPEYMRRAVERIASTLPNARATLLEGCGHDVGAAAKALAPLLTKFYCG